MAYSGKRVFSLLVFIFFLFTFLSSTQFSLPAYAGKATNGNYTGYFMVHPSMAGKKTNGNYTLYDVSDPVSGKVTNGNYTAYLGMVGIWAGLLGGGDIVEPIGPDISNLKIRRENDTVGSAIIVSFTTTTPQADIRVFEKTGDYATNLGDWQKWNKNPQSLTKPDPKQPYLFEYKDPSQVGGGEKEKYYMVTNKDVVDTNKIVGKFNIVMKPSALAVSVPFETPLILGTNIDLIIGNQLNDGDKLYSWTTAGVPVQSKLEKGLWTGPTEALTLKPEIGFWLVRMPNTPEKTVTLVGQISNAAFKEIKINKGYSYMIGNPYPFQYPLSSLTDLNKELDSSSENPVSKIYSWSDAGVPMQANLPKNANNKWEGTITKIETGKAYWIGNLTNKDINLKLTK